MTPPVDSATHCERDDDRVNCEIEITEEKIDRVSGLIEDVCGLDMFSARALAEQIVKVVIGPSFEERHISEKGINCDL